MSYLFHAKFSDKARRNVRFEHTNTILDNNGRYVIVTGRLQNTPVILVSIYAPTRDYDQFFVNLFAKISNTDNHHIIIGGDFNFVQDVCLDRSSPKQITSKSAMLVANYASRLGISDPWRFTNPQSKAFSFFSHTHHTFSQIDFFLLDDSLLT